jgi:hypothetical protein
VRADLRSNSVKAALIIVSTEEAPLTLSAAELDFSVLVEWWADLRRRGRVLASGKLAPRETARTISWRDSVPVVMDGPFAESKESVGGIVILEVDSEEEALEIAKSWPCAAGYLIEVRALLEPLLDERA